MQHYYHNLLLHNVSVAIVAIWLASTIVAAGATSLSGIQVSDVANSMGTRGDTETLFFGAHHRRLDSEFENDSVPFLVYMAMLCAAVFGFFVFHFIIEYVMMIPLWKEYKAKGKQVMGFVTGAKKKVRQETHGTVTPGLLYGGYFSSTTTEKTTNRILSFEYPVVVKGERKIVRKVLRNLHKKTYDRPSETDEVELLLLRDRGVFSAFPRDEFYLSASDKAKETVARTFALILFVALFIFGIRTKAPWWLFVAAIAIDILGGIGMSIRTRNIILNKGKLLRFNPRDDMEKGFNGDDCEHEETSEHYAEAELLASASPVRPEQAREPFANVVQSKHPSSTEMAGGDSPPLVSRNNPKKKKKGARNHSESKHPTPTSPLPSDICFGAESHPGTMDWRKAIEDSMEVHADDEYGPAVHRTIKKNLKNRDFWVKQPPGDESGKVWMLATKGEIVRQFHLAFDAEQTKFFKSSM